MPEINIPPCPTHGARPRALHEESFFGIVTVIEELIGTISGVGTSSYSRCSYGYPSNFEGVVRALEDLNTSISGISGGSANIAAGSGIYFTASGSTTVINATVVSASGLSIGAGSGIYLTQGGSVVNVDYDAVYDNVVSGHFLDEGSVTITYSGNNVIITGGGGGGGASVTVSGEPGTGYSTGDLWFDVNQGRMLVYASGGSVSDPDWYQTNAEAIVLKSDTPPSGTGTNAPPRDGSLWFSELVGSLFVYDAVTAGWYETGPRRSFAYSATAPSAQVAGEGWYDDTANALKVWNGSAWVDANT
jgi:hypothetical protein